MRARPARGLRGDARSVRSRASPRRSPCSSTCPKLVTAYYTERARSRRCRTARRVRHLRTSRLVASSAASTSGTCWRSRRRSAGIASSKGIDGPLFLGIDTHALSEPAFASALEVLAANGVDVMIAADDEYTPTPAISHAILRYNRGRTSAARRRHRDHAVAQSARRRRLQVQSAERRPGRHATSPAGSRPRPTACWRAKLAGVKRMPLATGAAAPPPRTATTISTRTSPISANVIDMDAIRGASIRMGVDPLGGAGVHYWPAIAERYGSNLTVVNDDGRPDVPLHDRRLGRQDPHGPVVAVRDARR